MSMNQFKTTSLNALTKAFESGKEEDIKQAVECFQNEVAEKIKEDYKAVQNSNDAAVLAQRGFRQLTVEETKWYQKVITAMKDVNPKQAFITAIADDAMPTTIIEDVFKHLKEEHPILNTINFQYVGFVTKWVLNDHASSAAQWGTITEAIAKEITSAFKVVDVKQSKLSAFAVVEQGMLDLGPVFMDKYIRECLNEALALGMEKGIIKGTGKDQPSGLTKDIHEGVEFNSVTGYPDKQKVVVTSFAPKEYGDLVAKMSKTEKGKSRKIASVCLACNQTEYLTKIMPATTVMTPEGKYQNNVFPFPTEVVICNELADNEAVLYLPNEYSMLLGGDKSGVLEFSDDYKFIEDQRAFKIKLYGTGRAFDNTCSVYLDTTGLKELYTVMNTPVPIV